MGVSDLVYRELCFIWRYAAAPLHFRAPLTVVRRHFAPAPPPRTPRTPLKWMMVRSELRAKVPLALPAARVRVLPDEMDAGAGRRRGMLVAQLRQHSARLWTEFARPCSHL